MEDDTDTEGGEANYESAAMKLRRRKGSEALAIKTKT